MRLCFLAAAALMLLSMSGCTEPDHEGTANVRLISESTSYSSLEQQRQLKAALAAANISFRTEVREGREFVIWDAKDSTAVKVALESPLGPELPVGRHSGFSKELNEEFERWLKANNVSYFAKSRDGQEFLVWSEKDDPRVQEWLRSRLPKSVYATMFGGGSSSANGAN